MKTSDIVPILEEIKKALGVTTSGDNIQTKPAQTNASSTAAAKAKLAELGKKSKAGVTDTTTVKATGSKRK